MEGIKSSLCGWLEGKFKSLDIIWHFLTLKLLKLIFVTKYLGVNVKPRTVIFESFNGRSVSDSPLAIYNTLCDKFDCLNLSYVWVVDSNNYGKYEHLIARKRTKVVKFNTNEYYKAYRESLIWVSNCRLPKSIHKSKNQTFVQCWHGTPIKKLGCDISITEDTSITPLARSYIYQQQSKSINLFLSPSHYATDKFKSAFFLEQNQVLEYGYPRSDRLINGFDSMRIKRLKERLGIPEGKKVVLYAPTYRDSIFSDKYSETNNACHLNQKLDEISRSSGNAVVLYRGHYFTNTSVFNENVIDVSNHNDVNEILGISDILITDYSSLIFDFALLKRPIICYLYDFERYMNKSRGAYLEIDETFPCFRTYSYIELYGILQAVLSGFSIEADVYLEFNRKYNPYEDGRSSERVVSEIIRLVNLS
ncbi:CDP-glycerol glycerophosphotransferase family protein [Vibrio sp. 10N.261.52.C2]|uniref:CDP-glycerol glycerophosphotransferase family protein n=1 Tax=Vibrio sp. 10N.261.52.C2 TaxID=3229681 RepID=UPI003552AF47